MNKIAIILILIILIAAGFYFLNKESIKTNKEESVKRESVKISMQIKSAAFRNNERIPIKFTCDGNNISPQISILDVPENAKSLALIMDDPDAPIGTWVHWTIWNIDSKTQEILEGGKIGMEGMTGFGKAGYGGPCPPPSADGRPHRYFFKLYALDAALNLPVSSKKEDLERAMEKHILSQSQIIGLYSRK